MLSHAKTLPFSTCAGLLLALGCSSPKVSAPPQEAGVDAAEFDGSGFDVEPADAPPDTADPADASDARTDAADDAADASDAPDATHCSDNSMNGDETDVDCGGTVCDPCGDSKGCLIAGDCSSHVCKGEICQVPTCSDGVWNGTEVARDCGGSCAACPGGACQNETECTTGQCINSKCACPEGTAIAPVVSGGAFCVDSTEVTWSQYYDFVTANPPVANQPYFCIWNTTYVPSHSDTWPPDPNDTTPVVYVDWCDAYAYCAWAGKRLCGGASGGASDFASYDQAENSEWFNACSALSAHAYPYGDAYAPQECFGADAFSGSTPGPQDVNVHAGATPGCRGGWDGLFDMSGNVAEWENSCSAKDGASDSCRVRGGSYASAQAALRCDADATELRNAGLPNVGFRCCD